MKNTLKEILFFTFIILSYIYIINNINYITNQTINTLNIALHKIIPILFPTILLSNLLYSSNIPYYINKYLKINPIYILSIITGSPTNAVILNKYNTDITKHLSLTNYPSLLFIYNYLNIIFNKKISIILIILNIVSNIILFLIIKPPKLPKLHKSNNNFTTIFSKSIKDSTNTLILIISTTIIYSILPTNLIKNTFLKSIILSITEITFSLNNLSINSLSINIKLLLSIITISTTGLCIQTQILNITNNIKIKEYIKNRLLHLVIYLILTYLSILIS